MAADTYDGVEAIAGAIGFWGQTAVSSVTDDGEVFEAVNYVYASVDVLRVLARRRSSQGTLGWVGFFAWQPAILGDAERHLGGQQHLLHGRLLAGQLELDRWRCTQRILDAQQKTNEADSPNVSSIQSFLGFSSRQGVISTTDGGKVACGSCPRDLGLNRQRG